MIGLYLEEIEIGRIVANDDANAEAITRLLDTGAWRG